MQAVLPNLHNMQIRLPRFGEVEYGHGSLKPMKVSGTSGQPAAPQMLLGCNSIHPQEAEPKMTDDESCSCKTCRELYSSTVFFPCYCLVFWKLWVMNDVTNIKKHQRQWVLHLWGKCSCTTKWRNLHSLMETWLSCHVFLLLQMLAFCFTDPFVHLWLFQIPRSVSINAVTIQQTAWWAGPSITLPRGQPMCSDPACRLKAVAVP